MAFEIPPQVLRQLRDRRSAQRREGPRSAVPASTTRFIDTLKGIFQSAKPDPGRAAEVIVQGMDQLQVAVEDQHDAFLLDPGMGPMAYLTSDGRVLWDERSWDGDEVHEVSGHEALATIVVGAKKTGITELLSLLPPAPDGASLCPKCDGERWATVAPGAGPRLVCLLCGGRGWAMPAELATARARGVLW